MDDPEGSPTPAPSPGDEELDAEGVEEDAQEEFQIPVLPRTPARNTHELIEILEQVTTVGLSLEEALIEGMGRLPVAGPSWWSDDWHAPRFDYHDDGTVNFRLHKGLDIFADFGTPIRSPVDGVVTRMSEGPRGGIGLWITDVGGARYYFAHLEGYAAGVEEGMRVEVGTVVGYVGDTGNAKGGAPHLHFEIHNPDAIPPKPIVDEWLEEALEAAEDWVEARIAEALGSRRLIRTERSLAGSIAADRTEEPSATPEYSIVLTLLDPVGGSVGMLPALPVVQPASRPPSDRLVEEFVRQRVDGRLIQGLRAGHLFGDEGV